MGALRRRAGQSRERSPRDRTCLAHFPFGKMGVSRRVWIPLGAAPGGGSRGPPRGRELKSRNPPVRGDLGPLFWGPRTDLLISYAPCGAGPAPESSSFRPFLFFGSGGRFLGFFRFFKNPKEIRHLFGPPGRVRRPFFAFSASPLGKSKNGVYDPSTSNVKGPSTGQSEKTGGS